MRLRPSTFGWRYFYVSTLAVILSGALTIALFFFFGPLRPDRRSVIISVVDTALHGLAADFGEVWTDRAVWPARFERFRREEALAAVRFIVLDTEGRVLYQEGETGPLGLVAPSGTARLTREQLVELLAGKSHPVQDLAYAVAPVIRGERAAGVLIGVLHPYLAGMAAPSRRFFPEPLVPIMAIILASGLASLYLVRGLRKRLAALTGAIRSMADGDYRSRLPLDAADEIGQVAGEFNHMADRLAEARDREQSLERLKRELIANVSHDLRGPLASMQGYLEAIEDGLARDPDSIRKYAGIVRQKSQALGKLVDDLLIYSRLESGDLPLERRAVDIADWLRQSLAKIEPDLALAGLTLEAEIPDTAGHAALDARRMDLAVANLAQNSVRYAPRGSTVRVCLRTEGDLALVSFANAGPGIDPADLPHVFDRFYQGKNRAEGAGAGLGLAIAAQLVRAHGGWIKAGNLPEGGVEFTMAIKISARR